VEVVEKHEIRKQRLFQRRLEGGKAAGFSPGCFSNLSDINTIDTAMKRE
jgi:hypothetical protein